MAPLTCPISSSTEEGESIISESFLNKSEVRVSRHCMTVFQGQPFDAGVKLRSFEGFNCIRAFTTVVSFSVQVQMRSSIVEYSCTFGVPVNSGGVSTDPDNNVFSVSSILLEMFS